LSTKHSTISAAIIWADLTVFGTAVVVTIWSTVRASYRAAVQATVWSTSKSAEQSAFKSTIRSAFEPAY
jgi:hypothetical protein